MVEVEVEEEEEIMEEVEVTLEEIGMETTHSDFLYSMMTPEPQ